MADDPRPLRTAPAAVGFIGMSGTNRVDYSSFVV